MTSPRAPWSIVVLAVGFMLGSCSPSENAAVDGYRSGPVERAATNHLWKIFAGKADSLTDTYAERVRLVPGHEFTLTRHGLFDGDARQEAVVVERAALIGAIEKQAEGRRMLPKEEIELLFARNKFETMEAAPGDFATAPAEPVGTSDGRIHFEIERGDVLLKLSPPGKNFIILQMREISGAWRVVAEYLD